MVKFMFKCFLLIIVLFFGVLIGMQQANHAMIKMKGYDDPALYSAFSYNEAKDGNKQASFLGQKVTSHDLEEKKKKLEEMKAFNFFSRAGKKLSDSISNGIQNLISKLLD